MKMCVAPHLIDRRKAATRPRCSYERSGMFVGERSSNCSYPPGRATREASLLCDVDSSFQRRRSILRCKNLDRHFALRILQLFDKLSLQKQKTWTREHGKGSSSQPGSPSRDQLMKRRIHVGWCDQAAQEGVGRLVQYLTRAATDHSSRVIVQRNLSVSRNN